MKILKEKGITLVALVVTIVVLIILATISINLIFGEEGILDRANEAQEKQRMAEVEDEIKLMLSDYIVEKGISIEEISLVSYLQEQMNKGRLDAVSADKEAGIVTVEKDRYEITIKESNLDIISIEESGGINATAETKIYQTTGAELEEGNKYNEIVVTVKITNKLELGTIESIVMKDSERNRSYKRIKCNRRYNSRCKL